MDCTVRVLWADPRPLAGIQADTTQPQLGTDIIRLLDEVWPVLREQGVRTGHNVVVYRGGAAGGLTIDAGVEVFTPFTAQGRVRATSTPSGEAAVAEYYGDYAGMAAAYAALDRWCADQERQAAGVNWEVYGDWAEDPAQLRTDVYMLLVPLPL